MHRTCYALLHSLQTGEGQNNGVCRKTVVTRLLHIYTTSSQSIGAEPSSMMALQAQTRVQSGSRVFVMPLERLQRHQQRVSAATNVHRRQNVILQL
jgi:hypothetical protein